MSRNSSYRRETYQRPRRRGMGCMVWLVALVWIVLLAVLGYRFFLRPQISQYLGDQIANQVNPPAPGSTARPGGATGDLAQQAGQALPTVVAALPAGQVRVSEQQANEFIAARAPQPFDTAKVRFVPGEVQIDLNAFGLTSTAHVGLAVQNGRVITLNPQIDGPLGQFISLADLTSSIEQQLNDQLAAQNRRLRDLQVNQGEIVVDVE